MTYEIRTYERICGKDYRKTYLVDDYKRVTCKKGDCIKFKQEGKKSCTYINAVASSYHEAFELTICEATTGKNIYKAIK